MISANALAGVEISGPASKQNKVLANFIGTNSKEAKLPNGGDGVFLHDGAAKNKIAKNKIAFNVKDGLKMIGGETKNNSTDPNSIFGNGGLGINLVGGSELPSGVTLNDLSDGDEGPNRLQNFPVLTSVVALAGGTGIHVEGSIDSLPGYSSYPMTLEFFDNSAADPSGFGEGQFFLGSLQVGGPGPFALDLPAANIVTATATDADGNTSEFSRAFPVLSCAFDVGSLSVIARGGFRLELASGFYVQTVRVQNVSGV